MRSSALLHSELDSCLITWTDSTDNYHAARPRLTIWSRTILRSADAAHDEQWTERSGWYDERCCHINQLERRKLEPSRQCEYGV